MLRKIVATFVLFATTFAVNAADLPGYPFIHVNAAASLHVTPDIGEIDFEIVSTDADLDAAWKIVTERLAAAKALFAGHGVTPDDISVQDIQRRPRKRDDIVEAIETRGAIHVTVRNLDGWTALIQAVMTMPNVESVAVAFSRSDADKIEAELVS